MSPAASGGSGSFKDLRPGAGGEAGDQAAEAADTADGPAPDVPARVSEAETAGAPDLEVVDDAPDVAPGTTQEVGSVEAERDDYLERLQRLQAEFENYRKRMTREQTDLIARAAERLAEELLPVLDACDAAVLQGADDVVPVQTQLLDILTKQGLEHLAAEGDPFDPDRHEAVMHEPGEDDDAESSVAEVLRAGYGWKGRVLRPAMVKVRG